MGLNRYYWRSIKTAPVDGTLVKTGKQDTLWCVPYPLNSKFIDGKWCALFGEDWQPFKPQPDVWRPVYPDDEEETARLEAMSRGISAKEA